MHNILKHDRALEILGKEIKLAGNYYFARFNRCAGQVSDPIKKDDGDVGWLGFIA